MTILLNHTIVPARNKEASAHFLAGLLGLQVEAPIGYFAAVRINAGLTFDYAEYSRFEPHHYAFQVSDAEFDAIFDRIQAAGIPYGSGPYALTDGQFNYRRGGRGVYFRDPDGHVLELLTRA